MTSELISALCNADIYPHATRDIALIETHISWVILTGDYAYKIKKPVNFGFLDFTTLAQRKQYCEAELSLNARSAPEIYLGLVAIYGSIEAPCISEDIDSIQQPIEYAIKMNQFEQHQLFSALSRSEELKMQHIEELADKVANFHSQVKAADPASQYGQPHQVYAPMRQNFEQIAELLDTLELDKHGELKMQLRQLEAWTESTFERLRPLLAARKQDGFVKDCHGDMHLGNLTLFRGHVTLFDCIEFNNDFRWIDVISDIAFLIMDFEDHKLAHFANRFLNNYLEHTGDYAGLKLLPFYKAYRATVRAKISLLSMLSPGLTRQRRAQLEKQYLSYIDLAERCSALPNRIVLTMHGLSGTGKSTVALRLVDRLGLVRIRSDVERKRIFDLDAQSHPVGELARELYQETSTRQTYHKLAELCAHTLDAGLSVVIDATNLKHWQREMIQHTADLRGVPVSIAYCQASMSVIREWIQKRRKENQDASDANFDVVDRQLSARDPLNKDELKQAFVIHSNILAETNELVSEIKKRFL